jgi:ethylbenzene dioxygenase alpha subunit
MIDPDRLANPGEGWVSREVYWDPAVYEAELERIFARCWLFVAHESQLPNPGDFLTTRMGQDGVIVTRRRDGQLAAYLNSCPHRGNKVCHAEAGNARGFVCNYHGWSFGLDGRLLGMWQQSTFENSAGYDAGTLGLVPVAQIESYKGLVFATFDPLAPPLDEYLGDFRWYLDVLLDNDDGGTEFLPGCIRSVLHCNWKVAAENFAGDALHAGWTHDSGARAMLGQGLKGDIDPSSSYSINVNGHCWEFALDMVGNAATFGDRTVARYIRNRAEDVEARLGKLRARMIGAASSVNVFPNFSFLPGQNSFRVWFPRGPQETELHTWVLVNRRHPPEIKEAYRRGAMLTFSPSGLFEMDDGENWEQTTLVNAGVVTRRQKLWFGLGQGTRVAHDEFPGNVFQGQINDANQRAFYRRWAQLLVADTWADVKGDPGTDQQ